MRICIDGIVRDMTEEEIAQAQAQSEQAEKEHWQTVDYGEAINSEIRKKYSESQEFAILRQKDEKPQEYVEYYEYCERCKTYVKKQKSKYEGEAE